MGKPIIEINDFGGMGSKNVYYLDGMRPDNMSGQSVLSMGYNVSHKLSEEYADFNGCCDMTKIDHENDGQKITWNGRYLNSYDFDNTAYNIGRIHALSTGGTGVNQIATGNDDGSSVVSTENDHLLYTSAHHLGFGYKGACTTDGTTTTLVDTDADFTDITTADSSSTMKVYNFTKEEEYTVASVTTTQITFTSAASEAPEQDDIYMLFVDGKWKFDVDSGRDNHFDGQGSPSTWFRRIILWEDSYYIANGNYISRLSSDLVTWAAEYKQLSIQTQCLEIDYNSSKILLSCDVNERGVMILWDGKETGGFLNKLELDSSTTAMTRHGSGFVYNIGAKLYYTDGYSSNDFATIPSVRQGRRDLVLDRLNNIKSSFGNIFMIINNDSGVIPVKSCVAVYDKSYGFTQFPMKNTDSYNYAESPSGLYFFREYGVNENFVSYEDGEISPKVYSVGKIYTSPPKQSTVIFNIKLPQKTSVSMVELNLGQSFNSNGNDTATPLDSIITVSVGNGQYPFWRVGRIDSGVQATTTSITNVSGAYSHAKVGDEILMLEGNTGGDRSFVTAIANARTSSETLTISPALSDIISIGDNPTYNIMPLKRAGQRTMTKTNNQRDYIFPATNVGYTDNLFIEVHIAGGLYVDILNVKVF